MPIRGRQPSAAVSFRCSRFQVAIRSSRARLGGEDRVQSAKTRKQTRARMRTAGTRRPEHTSPLETHPSVPSNPWVARTHGPASRTARRCGEPAQGVRRGTRARRGAGHPVRAAGGLRAGCHTPQDAARLGRVRNPPPESAQDRRRRRREGHTHPHPIRLGLSRRRPIPNAGWAPHHRRTQIAGAKCPAKPSAFNLQPRHRQSQIADDTPVKVLAPGTGKTATGRAWTYVRGERPWQLRL